MAYATYHSPRLDLSDPSPVAADLLADLKVLPVTEVDDYAVSALYYDALAEAQGDKARPYVPFFTSWAVAGQRALDVGAGTGRVTLALAEAGVDVVAVEPSRSMRAALLSKMVGRADLRPRVTVLPGDGRKLNARGEFDYLCLAGVLSFFDHGSRPTLFAELATRARPGSLIALDMLGFEDYQAQSRRLAGRIELGECTYALYTTKIVAGPSSCRSAFEYETHYGDELIERRTLSRTRNYVERSHVAEELAAFGFFEEDTSSLRSDNPMLAGTLVARFLD